MPELTSDSPLPEGLRERRTEILRLAHRRGGATAFGYSARAVTEKQAPRAVTGRAPPERTVPEHFSVLRYPLHTPGAQPGHLVPGSGPWRGPGDARDVPRGHRYVRCGNTEYAASLVTSVCASKEGREMGIWSSEDQDETGEEGARETTARSEPSRASTKPREAVIGPSITIDGEVTGSEDLTIDGHVTGSVDLEGHALTVGPEGEIEADITARVVTVAGQVVGDLTADDQVTLRGSARVEGDITSPGLELEEGSYFRGEVDMGARHERPSRGGPELVTDDEKETAGLA